MANSINPVERTNMEHQLNIDLSKFGEPDSAQTYPMCTMANPDSAQTYPKYTQAGQDVTHRYVDLHHKDPDHRFTRDMAQSLNVEPETSLCTTYSVTDYTVSGYPEPPYEPSDAGDGDGVVTNTYISSTGTHIRRRRYIAEVNSKSTACSPEDIDTVVQGDKFVDQTPENDVVDSTPGDNLVDHTPGDNSSTTETSNTHHNNPVNTDSNAVSSNTDVLGHDQNTSASLVRGVSWRYGVVCLTSLVVILAIILHVVLTHQRLTEEITLVRQIQDLLKDQHDVLHLEYTSLNEKHGNLFDEHNLLNEKHEKLLYMYWICTLHEKWEPMFSALYIIAEDEDFIQQLLPSFPKLFGRILKVCEDDAMNNDIATSHLQGILEIMRWLSTIDDKHDKHSSVLHGWHSITCVLSKFPSGTDIFVNHEGVKLAFRDIEKYEDNNEIIRFILFSLQYLAYQKDVSKHLIQQHYVETLVKLVNRPDQAISFMSCKILVFLTLYHPGSEWTIASPSIQHVMDQMTTTIMNWDTQKDMRLTTNGFNVHLLVHHSRSATVHALFTAWDTYYFVQTDPAKYCPMAMNGPDKDTITQAVASGELNSEIKALLIKSLDICWKI